MADTTEQMRRFVEQCEQLEREGGEEIAETLRGLVVSGQLSLDNAIDVIETAEAVATKKTLGQITADEATEIAEQMALRHARRVAG